MGLARQVTCTSSERSMAACARLGSAGLVRVRVRVGVRVRVRVGVTVTVTVRVGQPPEAFAGCECREHDVTHAQPQRAWYVVVSTW